MVSRKESAAATRAALVKSARRLFAEKGFYDSGTHEIVDAAGVTRGALRHHFPRKEDLFRAVYIEVLEDTLVNARALMGVDGNHPLTWQELMAGLDIYLAAATVIEVQRILMIDGPAILGLAQWRDLQSMLGLDFVQQAVEDAIASGRFAPQPVRPLAMLVTAVIAEAAIVVATAEAPEDAVAEMQNAVSSLFAGLHVTPGQHVPLR